jgi:hypothetical protein
MDDTPPDRLQKLWGHLGNMTPEQIRESIRQVRADRRIVKQRTAVKKKARDTSDSARLKIKDLASDLSPDALERLLRGMK